MSLSRRQFLSKGFSALALASLPSPLLASSDNPLIIPPLLTNAKGKPILLTADATYAKLSDKSTTMWGMNGHYPLPTLKLYKNKFAKFHWKNNLNQPLAMHIQGLQAMGELYGGLSRTLKSGEDWSPIVPIVQSNGMGIYRASTLKQSAYQNYRGLTGLCLFEDENQRLNLPNQYGINDIPLILQDMQINEQGNQLFDTQSPFLGNRLMVNGQENCFIKVPTAVIRLRLVNASLSRSYFLQFADNRPFYLIALDQGFLAQSLPRQTLNLAPGERAEILVDLTQGGEAILLGGKKVGAMERLTNAFNSQFLQSTQVIRLVSEDLPAAFPSPVKYSFPQEMENLRKKSITQVRKLHIDTQNATINGKKFNPRHIDFQVKASTVEHWTITSDKPTTFCLQGARFIVAKMNHQNTPNSLWAWKDTVHLSNHGELLVSFEHRSSSQFPFFFGASEPLLADRGAMGMLVVE